MQTLIGQEEQSQPVLRMVRPISDAPPVWVVMDWRLGHSGNRIDLVGTGVSGRITNNGAKCRRDEDSV